MRVPQLLFQVTDLGAGSCAAVQLAHDEPRPVERATVAVTDAEKQKAHSGDYDYGSNRSRQNLDDRANRHGKSTLSEVAARCSDVLFTARSRFPRSIQCLG